MRMQNKIKFILIMLCICLLMGACSFPNIIPASTGTDSRDKSTGTEAAETAGENGENENAGKAEYLSDTGRVPDPNSGISITVLDVGQGLSVLIRADGHNLIYDGGGRENSSFLISYLKELEISSFDYLVSSHYDEDHLAGLVGVLYNYPVSTVLCGSYSTDTAIYTSFQKALSQSNAEILYPCAGDSFTLGNARIEVTGPFTYSQADEDSEYSTDNNNSIALRITYGNYHCLLTGDAQKEEEQEMLDSGEELSADLYIVGHHGSSNASGTDFLQAVNPKAAIISCGADNDYGHPAKKTMDTLKKRNVLLYRTDLQGTISCLSDGEEYWFSAEPCSDYSPGTVKTDTEASESASSDTDSETTYIINMRSLVFHYPDCMSVEKMSEKNKKATTESREQLIKEGYTPCGNCNP